MVGQQSAGYRLKLAWGFLDEARQDTDLGRWRSVVDNAQLAVENAAKSVLALLGPVGRTHNPAAQLREALDEGLYAAPDHSRALRLAELAEVLGPDVHIQTDYGDETEGHTPWELFDETDARQALAMAEEAINLAQVIVETPRDDVSGDARKG